MIKSVTDRFGNTYKLEPGLNILVGPCRTGKTTLLNDLADYGYANELGFTNNYSLHWKDVLIINDSRNEKFKVEGDTKYVTHINPSKHAHLNSLSPGADKHLGSEFTNDHLIQRFEDLSEGEWAEKYWIRLLENVCEGLFPETFEKAIKEERFNEDTVPLVLLDEIDRSMDTERKLRLYGVLTNPTSFMVPIQTILVSHDTFAFKLKNCNIIETKKGFIKETEETMKNLLGEPKA